MGSWDKISKLLLFLAFTLFTLGILPTEQNAIFGGNSGGPLYTSTDQVFILNATNLKSHIYGSTRAWVVEFYSSWCGHCIHYAPKWKQFAIDLAPWQNVVVISGIDCADENNVAICREYEVMGYPSIRFFPKNAPELKTIVKDGESKQETNRGEQLDRSENMMDTKRLVIEALVNDLPNLQSPPDGTIRDSDQLWSYIKKTTKLSIEMPSFILVLFESDNSFVGKEVGLHLSKYPSVRIIRFHKKNPLYDILKLSSWPAAGYLSQDNTSGTIILDKNHNLSDFLAKAVIGLAQLPDTSSEESNINQIIQAEDKNKENAPVVESKPAEDQLSNIEEPRSNANTVSVEDLIHAVRNSLRNEIGLHKQIAGSKLQALKNYVHTLAEFFPADRREMMMFLMKLSTWLLPFEQLDDTTYFDKLTELELDLHPWDIEVNTWGNCKGSVHGRRGYPCSLWSLFHTLTVVAHEKNQNFPVLDSIHSFVKEFFGCRECSEHFTKMVADDGALMITPIKDQVLWLWKAHNKVNLRLKGSLSEDPKYPKIQYPSQAQCSECYGKDAQFDEDNVLQFLIKVYSKPDRTLQPAKIIPDHLESGGKSGASELRPVGFFTGIDYWLFCIVYLSVALLLIFGYIHFRARRKMDISMLFCRKLLLPSSGKSNV